MDILAVIVAQKLKKRVDEVPLRKSIKDLVGGKSTLQNKILGDLQHEFTSVPEKGEKNYPGRTGIFPWIRLQRISRKVQQQSCLEARRGFTGLPQRSILPKLGPYTLSL